MFVWVRNLFDENYMQNLTVQAGNSGLILGTPSDPRTIGVTLRAPILNLATERLPWPLSGNCTLCSATVCESRSSDLAQQPRQRFQNAGVLSDQKYPAPSY